jgi:diguanylate cyclase (GGDEF)-like protein
MMPHLDGYGLVKALRETAATAAVPIIMLTAKADRRDVRMGMNLGADDYLTKPYRREELLDAVHARLARKASLAENAQRLQAEALEAQQRDALTGLPGRELFGLRLKSALTPEQGEASRTVGLVCLGLDGFSKINDSLGAAVGDKVLVEVASRLSEYMRGAPHTMGYDCVARLGSDQFAICLGDDPDLARIEEAATQLLQLLAQPYRIADHTLFLTASAGASLYPQQAGDAHALLLNAETALHHAKPAGPGTVRVFDAEMNQQVARRLQVHNALHGALDQNELMVYYQPQVCIASGDVVGFEALLRWHHPTLGWVSPAEFIPIAEESGFITRIGAWAMRTAATQAAQWHAQGHLKFRMAVNLSVRQFVGNNLPELVSTVLAETGLPAGMLELEVTESLALHSVASTLATLHDCKALGVKLAMDDFGTGYSSLAYLKRYPLDCLKIDQTFVRNITQDVGDAAITRAIVAMAHSFGMSVIAEGVETIEQLDFLRTLGCEEFQGYLFSRPVPADQAVKCFAGFTLPTAPDRSMP